MLCLLMLLFPENKIIQLEVHNLYIYIYIYFIIIQISLNSEI
jgi:hypothetical protein